jgi:hypothetical protein
MTDEQECKMAVTTTIIIGILSLATLLCVISFNAHEDKMALIENGYCQVQLESSTMTSWQKCK